MTKFDESFEVYNFLLLPDHEAIKLHEYYRYSNQELYNRMTEALVEIREMSVYSKIRDISMRPQGVFTNLEKDDSEVLKCLGYERRYLSDPDLTIKDAVKKNLADNKSDIKDFAMMGQRELELYMAKLEYFCTKFDKGV